MGKDKKKHKKKHKHTSSSGNSSPEEEWVEMNPVPAKSDTHSGIPREGRNEEKMSDSDDWLMNSALFACTSRDEIRQKKEDKKDKKENDKYMLDKLGQTNRELNPYWKNGGSGLPQEVQVAPESLRQASVTVGDQGVNWLRKALQRAKEQAAEQGRSLQQVVAERWGSLEKLESMISAAEEREQLIDSSLQYKSKYRHDSSKARDVYGLERGKNEDRPQSANSNFKEKVMKESNKKSTQKKYIQPHEKDDKIQKFNHDNYSKMLGKSFKKPIGSEDDSSSECKYKNYEKHSKPSEEQKSSRSVEADKHNRKYDQRKSKSDVSKKKYSKKRYESTSSSSEEEEEEDRHYKKGNRRDSKRDTASRKNRSRNKYDSSLSSSSEDSEHNNKNYSNRDKKNKSHHGVKKEAKRAFIKPNLDSDNDSDKCSNQRQSYKQQLGASSSKGWKKKTQPSPSKECVDKSDQKVVSSSEESVKSVEVTQTCSTENVQVLTDKEMNDLGAKLVKAELLGNQELAKELKAKLERAREAKANEPNESKVSDEVMLLTHTDSKGFTRPVSLSGPLEPAGGRRKGRKVETHTEGKRMRYFADDDKYSLQEMFQREKLSTVEDSNAVFAKLASKGVGRDDSARDMDDVFEETARVEEADGRKHARERHQAIEQSKRTARSLDNCQWCLESKQMLKHLIVAMGRTCYLCVPPYQSLTDNHCLLVPSFHTPCATQLDEDVWREMQDFRKSIVQMFLSQDEDVLFFESARNLNKFPHMVINCVPMPKETGDLAPIYFKKAIQECEMEWSNNKKLVELKGRDVRKAVPRGLPYFAVDFGMESGFAHVIEDEKLFPLNFAQEIIGGMLDLDHTIWRKQRKQTFEEQSKKVIQLTKLWKQFDCTIISK